MSEVIDMGYYEPQERRTEQINVRMPRSTKARLERLAELWTHLEQVRSGDDDASVSISDVVLRLVQVGLDGAWSEIGGEPQTDAELEKVKQVAAEKLAPPLAANSEKKRK